MQKQIELINLSLGYNSILLQNANAELLSSEISVLIGENGIGKSTLIQAILKQKSILLGEIKLMGKKLDQISQQDLAKIISVVYSKSTFSDNLTVFDVVSLGKFHLYPYYIKLNKKDLIDVETLIDELNLTNYINYPLSSLSDGNLQKCFIARALAQDTPIIILDEPTTHLDDNNKNIIHDLLYKLAKNKQKTILFSSHDWLSSQRISHYVWEIKNKKLHTEVFEDYKQNHLLINQNSLIDNAKLPKINANTLQTKDLIDFINKNQFNDLSQLEITLNNEFFTIINNNSEIKLNNWNNLKEYLIKI